MPPGKRRQRQLDPTPMRSVTRSWTPILGWVPSSVPMGRCRAPRARQSNPRHDLRATIDDVKQMRAARELGRSRGGGQGSTRSLGGRLHRSTRRSESQSALERAAVWGKAASRWGHARISSRSQEIYERSLAPCEMVGHAKRCPRQVDTLGTLAKLSSMLKVVRKLSFDSIASTSVAAAAVFTSSTHTMALATSR